MKAASVHFLISYTVSPCAIYYKIIPYFVNLNTAFYVINQLTHFGPVIGIDHYFTTFDLPSGLQCYIAIITVDTEDTRFIAPPTPLTFYPGIMKFARSPD